MAVNKEILKIKFKNYIKTFDLNDENIERKYFHSLRVMDLAENIAISENLNENDIEICLVAGLLHDYARFTQWTIYHTYSDLKSVDHGDLGVEMLFNRNEVLKIYTNVKNYDEIYDAIKYHNKYSVSDILSEHNKKITFIIRDADKLDIFDLLVQGAINLKESHEEISKEIEKQFYENKSINYKIVNNENDDIMLKLAMLFDLKYKYSIKYVLENNILDKLYSKIKNKKRFKKYFEYMNDYLINLLNKLQWYSIKN